MAIPGTPIRLILYCLLIVAVQLLPLSVVTGYTAQRSGTIDLSDLVEAELQRHPDLTGSFVLEKGEDSLLAKAWLAEHAEQSIHVQYFIWSTDNVGILTAESLFRPAERGVQVKIIVDDVAIDAPDNSLLALALHPNISIKIYNPLHSVSVSMFERIQNLFSDFRAFNQRMHDITMLVDGKIGIIGGRNMADEYYDFNRKFTFRDRDILVLGPVVEEREKSFTIFWNSPFAEAVDTLHAKEMGRMSVQERQKIYRDLHAYASDPANYAPDVQQAVLDISRKFEAIVEDLVWSEVEFLHHVPGKNDGYGGLGGGGQITTRLVKLLENAEKNIIIELPYLVMPEGALKLFKGIGKKGVEISFVTNSLASTDNIQAFSGYSRQRDDILSAGIKVYEFKPCPAVLATLCKRYGEEGTPPIYAIHAKSMVIDGETLHVGTFNFDPRSSNLNPEVGILVKNQQLAVRLKSLSRRTCLRKTAGIPGWKIRISMPVSAGVCT